MYGLSAPSGGAVVRGSDLQLSVDGAVRTDLFRRSEKTPSIVRVCCLKVPEQHPLQL